MSADVPWLDEHEDRLWRSWVRLTAQMSAVLKSDLAEDGLSSSDFEVLVHLTDDPDGRVRITDLAGLLQWERSRVSHHVARMERRGLVRRTDCAEDGRGAFVVVTAAGRHAIEHAAPGHVRSVRRLLFDALDPDELASLSRLVDKLVAVHPAQATAS